MSFSNVNTFIQYTADGIQDTFAINFHILENSDEIEAKLIDITDPYTPVEVVLAYSIDHTNYPASEVVFISPPAADLIVHISRKTLLIQNSNFEKGSFPAEAVEETFDKALMVAQENSARLDRALLNPEAGTQATIQQVLDAVNIAENAEARLDQHDLDIAQNQADIATNNSAIGANTAAISANTSNIATEANRNDDQDIDIAAAQGTADAAQSNLDAYKWSVTAQALSGTYALVDRGIHIAKSATQTLNLPSPTSGAMCKVKKAGNYTGVVVQSAAGIDGFGVSYTLQSSYESITLVSDGTQWFII